MIPTLLVESGNAHFKRGITSAGPHTRERSIYTVTTFFYRDHGVSNTQSQVMVCVHTGLGFRLQNVFQGAKAIPDVIHIHSTTGIDDVQARSPEVFHHLRSEERRVGKEC